MPSYCKKVLGISITFSKFSNFLHETKPSSNLIKNKLLIRNIHNCSYLSAKVSFNLSDIGEGIRDVIVKEWYVNVGDKVAQFDDICEVQSDKASVTITSRYDGTITKLYYKVDDVALVGKPLVDIETEEDEDSSSSSSDEEAFETVDEAIKKEEVEENLIDQKDVQRTEISQPTLCIPSVRRLAKEHNVNLTVVKGTGKGGRILKEDVLEYLQTKSDSKIPATRSEKDRVESIKGFKKVMVKTMTESLKVACFVYSDEIKVGKISELRTSLKVLPELKDVKISFIPFFVKAVSNALQRFPILNASVDEECENITYHSKHNIGIAMDTKIGLAVPVIKNVERLGVIEIARELNRLMEAGKNGSFSPSDLQGGTFAISNIGVIGGTYTKPIPLPPQVAIIALGSSQVLPRFDANMQVVAEEIINISTAADHRIIDGATVANFTQIVKKQIENPYLLFLNV